MRGALAVLAGLAGLALAACDPPRSQSYFETHAKEAASIIAACRSGQVRGGECDNALAADKKRRDDARRKLYRDTF